MSKEEFTKMKHIKLLSLAVAVIVQILGCTTQAASTSTDDHSLTQDEVRAELDAWHRADLEYDWDDEAPDTHL